MWADIQYSIVHTTVFTINILRHNYNVVIDLSLYQTIHINHLTTCMVTLTIHQTQIKSLPMHRTAGIAWAYVLELHVHTYIVFIVAFTLLGGGLMPGSNLLILYSRQLVVAGYYYYYCLSNNQGDSCKKTKFLSSCRAG